MRMHFADSIPRKYRVRAMMLCGTMVYFFANVQRVAIPGSVFNQLQQELHVSAAYITALGSAFMYVYAVTQLVIGLLLDRYGSARIIATGGLLFCAGSILFPLTHSLPLLYLIRILTGLGAGALYLSLVKESIRIFNRNYNLIVSVILLIGYSGAIAANAPLVAGIEAIGFRNMMLLVGISSLLFLCLFLSCGVTVKLPPVQKNVQIRFGKFISLLKTRHNRHLLMFGSINFGLYYVMQTVIGKKFLEDFCGMASVHAAWVLSIMGTLSAVSGLMFAVSSRLVGNRRRVFCRIVGITSFSVCTSMLMLVLFGIHSRVFAVLLCMLSVTSGIQTILLPLAYETNPQQLGSVAVALMNFSAYVAVAIFGNAVGLLMSLFAPVMRNGIMYYGRSSYLAVFMTLTLFSAIVLRCSWRMRETMGRNVCE